MALTTCPDCGNTLSTEAVACARCGRPSPKTKGEDKAKQRNALLLLLIILGATALGIRTLYRSFTGADLVGTTCTLRIGSGFDRSGKVPLQPTKDEAMHAYSAGLMGRATEADLARATWVSAETTATITAVDGLAYRVTALDHEGWVPSDFCKR